MSEETKICPECGAEFFPHVVNCSSCEVALIRPGEKKELPRAEGALVCIDEGTYERATELAMELKRAGVECEVLNISKGKSCSSGAVFGLFVHQSVARQVVGMIDGIMKKFYPELLEADARLEAGLCPACGAAANGAPECPDCGLNLGGGHGANGCGGDCGPC
ncbi:MAG: hypothetical protein HY889_02320 [Deltaproteobacteria bacterium]|nr:hypothetical protein [Deltaproteobacteria bacterium]